jgi:hypothetical protein
MRAATCTEISFSSFLDTDISLERRGEFPVHRNSAGRPATVKQGA